MHSELNGVRSGGAQGIAIRGDVPFSSRIVPSVPGVLDEDAVRATGAWIASVQKPSGEIPWFTGGHTDPWDHVESAMGLTVSGQWEAARRAFGFLRDTQRADGSWPIKWQDGEIADADTDANFCAYIAVGLWHHHLVTGAREFLESMWPTVCRALDLVLAHQGPQGQIWWGSSPRGFCDEALVTGSSSIHHALRCGVAIADELGESAPEWDLAADRLGHALRAHPELFTPKPEFSMDWFYPVLTGVMVGEQARRRIDARWDDFVVDGLGIRCVDHRPWVTGAETCEFVLALEAVGRHDQALEQFSNMQHLREEDGSYWTGLVFADGKRWPVELSTWTGAVVLLAADALSRTTPGNEIFRYVSAHTTRRLQARPGDPADCVPGEACPTALPVH